MYFSIVTLIKVIFTGVQVFLTLLFIQNAFVNWESYPTVTSVEFRKIEKELFPAVTVCYPNTWKWPGIIKVLSKWGEAEERFDINRQEWHTNVSGLYSSSEQIWYQDIFLNIGKKRGRVATETGLGIDGITIVDFIPSPFCNEINKWTIPKQQKLGRIILNMLEQINTNDEFETFMNSIDVEKRWKHWKETLAFEEIKADVCQLEFLDCEKDDDVCHPSYSGNISSLLNPLHFAFHMPVLNNLWFINRFWTPLTILQSQKYKAFKSVSDDDVGVTEEELFIDSNLAIVEYLKLYENNRELSQGYPLDAFALWHYLKGIYVSPEENMVKLLHLKFAYSYSTDFYPLCFDESSCEMIELAMEVINQGEMKSYLDLMDQPKVHGDESEDFVLIPFCSFGPEPLKACSEFEKSKVVYQDDTCFTYEHPNETNYKHAKFQFVLNMRENMPKDKPLSVKVLLHEQGRIPDVLEIDSASQEIYAEKDLTKIGIIIDSNEVTDTFEKMPFEKRNCRLDGEVANYSRMDCLTQNVFQEAWKACHCTPWTMGKLINDSAGYCNVTGAICFREFTSKAQESIGDDTCPKMCSYKQYKMLSLDNVRFDPFVYGNEYVEYLINNPTKQLLDELQDPNTGDLLFNSREVYIKKNGEAFSMVQFFLHDPQMTVITKDAKVTLPDMVSNIGGTIGIFLGLSTISVLDILIEFFNFINRKYFENGKKRMTKTNGAKDASNP